MSGHLAVIAALALVAGCNKSDPKPGPAQEPGAKPQPSQAAPDAIKPPEAAASQTWETFTSKDGGFVMELPGKPQEREQGGLKMVGAEFGATADDPRTAMCGASWLDLPTQGNEKPDPKVVLDAAIARHKQDAKVIEEKAITLGAHPGTSLIVENTSHRKWMRVYLVDGRFYTLNCGGPFDRAATDGPIALKSLASFALKK
jgi:hypothetical protein